MGARRAGPASDSRRFGAGFLIVAGTGMPDLAFARGSATGCMTDRRLESMVARQGCSSCMRDSLRLFTR